MMNDSPAAEFLDFEVNDPLANLELQSESYFPKLRVGVFDPMPKSVRREGGHVAGENNVNQLANRFALLFGVRMHGHAAIGSRMDAGVTLLLVPNSQQFFVLSLLQNPQDFSK
jgi:hypothetical protein